MRTLQRAVCGVVLGALFGCSSLPRAADPAAGITEAGVAPIGPQRAVWLAAPRPGLSAVGKDYLFVGPMTVNRDGNRLRYLWFGVGTTLDRRLTGAPEPTLESVVMLVDGTPMTFDLIAWGNDAESAPYPLAIESDASYAARITGSQLRQLANAASVAAYVIDANGRSPLFEVVDGDPADWLAAGGRRPR